MKKSKHISHWYDFSKQLLFMYPQMISEGDQGSPMYEYVENIIFEMYDLSDDPEFMKALAAADLYFFKHIPFNEICKKTGISPGVLQRCLEKYVHTFMEFGGMK